MIQTIEIVDYIAPSLYHAGRDPCKDVFTVANIRKIEGKTGAAYKITVSQGRDSSGKQRRRYMTWPPSPGMTARQAGKGA